MEEYFFYLSFGPQAERLADQTGDIIVQVVDDPSVAGNCFNDGLAEVPLLPGDAPGGEPSEGCDANPFDNGFAFGFDDPFADQRAADNRFNVPPVFDAMDTQPFFHRHQINTVEGAVGFYATNRHLRDGTFLPAIVPLNGAQVINVARFMRVMGADFNIESAKTLLEKALGLRRFRVRDRKTNVKLAIAEVKDALELLRPAELHFEDADPKLVKAQNILKKNTLLPTNIGLRKAKSMLEQAQRTMIDRG